MSETEQLLRATANHLPQGLIGRERVVAAALILAKGRGVVSSSDAAWVFSGLGVGQPTHDEFLIGLARAHVPVPPSRSTTNMTLSRLEQEQRDRGRLWTTSLLYALRCALPFRGRRFREAFLSCLRIREDRLGVSAHFIPPGSEQALLELLVEMGLK